MAVGEDVYCTLVMSDTYLVGAAVLAHSLRSGGSKKKLACLIDQPNLRASTVTELQAIYDYTIPINVIANPYPANLYLINRPDLLFTFTKIQLWRQTQFRTIVYIDSDVVALRAPDELFNTEEDFAAAPDVGFPDIFNSGVMVLKPNMGDYWALRNMAAAGDSFDGADQGLLNQYYEHKGWKRLSFTYNCTPSANYQYEPAYRYYKRDISLVHFIGREKPWQKGRASEGPPGAYQELGSRWWAVYDRHYKVSTSHYKPGQRDPGSYVVQREVKGEIDSADHGYYATGYPVESTQPAPPPEAQATTTEAPFTEPGEEAENIDQGRTEPRSTVELRRFSAPHMEWDATQGAPPPRSKPEAANFPTSKYEFNNDPAPFRPPASYAQPPRDMHYEVSRGPPKPREEKLAPIFPWEEREGPKPSRVFIDDEPPRPRQPEPELEPEFAGADELEVQAGDSLEPITPTTHFVDHQTSLQAFGGATNKNAWDEVSGIEDYVRALTAYQRNRGKVQLLDHHPTTNNTQQQQNQEQQHILSPTNEPDPQELIEKVAKRRESLILTDFPSEVERPSLPVTPAPRRRSSFWGVERGEDGGGGDGDGSFLQPADGVPGQADWDPSAQLEQLRRNSLMDPADLKLPARKSIPNRSMPSTSATIPEEAPDQPHVHFDPTPTFSEPDFAAESVLAPTALT